MTRPAQSRDQGLTAQEFIDAYAHRSNVSVAFLLSNGRRVMTCHCDSEQCQGWQVIGEQFVKFETDRGEVLHEVHG